MQKGNRMTLKDADKIKEAIQNSDDFVGGSDDIIKVIDSVPEVVISTDTISRAKAIEALDKRFDSIPMEQTSEILMLRKDLRNLPPAQPEHIIHCKDCENHIYRDWCRMVQHATSDYSDCARELNAKRKENDDE
jgi:hypothetical protein